MLHHLDQQRHAMHLNRTVSSWTSPEPASHSRSGGLDDKRRELPPWERSVEGDFHTGACPGGIKDAAKRAARSVADPGASPQIVDTDFKRQRSGYLRFSHS